jgi:small-conductance mechanosensitive channel
MNYFESWNEAFLASIQNVWVTLISFIPSLIGALVVLIIGLIIASAFGKVVRKLVHLTRLDDLIKTVGFEGELKKMGLNYQPSDVLGWVVKWFFIIAVLIAVADILKWNSLTAFLEDVALYIPNVIVAVVILVVGMVAGQFVSSIVVKAVKASSMAHASAELLGTIAKWAIVVFAVMATLIQLGIASDLLRILFTGLVAMLSIAGGLAFGLGGREKAREIIDKLSK